MPTRHQRQFIVGQAAVMLGMISIFSIYGVLSLETFFMGSFLGLLLLFVLTEPEVVMPQWRSQLRRIIVLGTIGFVLLIARRIVIHLPPGLL